MANEIILPNKDGEVVKIDGECYEFVGFTKDPVTHASPDETFSDCEDCYGSSSSGSESGISSSESSISSSEESLSGISCAPGQCYLTWLEIYAETDCTGPIFHQGLYAVCCDDIRNSQIGSCIPTAVLGGLAYSDMPSGYAKIISINGILEPGDALHNECPVACGGSSSQQSSEIISCTAGACYSTWLEIYPTDVCSGLPPDQGLFYVCCENIDSLATGQCVPVEQLGGKVVTEYPGHYAKITAYTETFPGDPFYEECPSECSAISSSQEISSAGEESSTGPIGWILRPCSSNEEQSTEPQPSGEAGSAGSEEPNVWYDIESKLYISSEDCTGFELTKLGCVEYDPSQDLYLDSPPIKGDGTCLGQGGQSTKFIVRNAGPFDTLEDCQA